MNALSTSVFLKAQEESFSTDAASRNTYKLPFLSVVSVQAGKGRLGMGSLRRASWPTHSPAQPLPVLVTQAVFEAGQTVVVGLPTGARLFWKCALLGIGLWVTAGVDSRRDCHFCDLITKNPVRITCVSFIDSVPPSA